MNSTCLHLDQIRNLGELDPTLSCWECERSGSGWVHLTMCLSCGYVGCCDDSKKKHAHQHFHQTHHPIVRSLQANENWMWCYVDELFLTELAA